jgi:GTP cyclohydrolase I
MKIFGRFVSALVALLVLKPLCVCVGYGPRTYVQGLAKIAKTLLRYIQKHEVQLRAALTGNDAAITCLDSLLTCLVALAELLNESAG